MWRCGGRSCRMRGGKEKVAPALPESEDVTPPLRSRTEWVCWRKRQVGLDAASSFVRQICEAEDTHAPQRQSCTSPPHQQTTTAGYFPRGILPTYHPRVPCWTASRPSRSGGDRPHIRQALAAIAPSCLRQTRHSPRRLCALGTASNGTSHNPRSMIAAWTPSRLG